jgi:Putative binding domain, N-terminal
VPPSGGTGTISVTTLSTCAWTSSSGTSWISLTGSGPGSGNATYTIGANTGTTLRTALVTVAGVSVRFNQDILTAPLAPTNLRVIK